MRRLVVPITYMGMAMLLIGLLVSVVFETTGIDIAAAGYVKPFGHMPAAYVLANSLWLVGAVVLIVPPLVEGYMLLVVLEIFLALSAGVSFWQPEDMSWKFALRIACSIVVLWYLKRQGLVTGRWAPKEIWVTGDGRCLAVGLELLGIGYALGWMALLTLGSVFLIRSSLALDKVKPGPIPKAFALLNGAYVAGGFAICVAQLVR